MNVGLIILAIFHALSALSLVIIPILPITAAIERAFMPDKYSEAPKAFCDEKFSNWNLQQREQAAAKCVSDNEYSALGAILCEADLQVPPEACGGVFDNRYVSVGSPKLLEKWTISDELVTEFWPFWWVFVLWYLANWVFIYVILGFKSLSPMTTLKAILNRTAFNDEGRPI